MPSSPLRPLELQDHRLRYLYLSHLKGSMRAAADELGIAASSVSRQIAKLEAELGIDLVRQDTYRIHLTDAGEAAVEYYLERLAQHETLMKRFDVLRALQAAPRIIIAIGEGLLGAKTIKSLQAISGQRDAQIAEIISAPSFEVQRLVISDQAHLGIVFCPGASAQVSRLFSLPQPLRLIVHPSNPIAQQNSVTFEEVSEQTLVLPSSNYRVRELIDGVSKIQGVPINPELTSNSLAVILDFVRSGLGATVLAELPITDEIHSGTLKAVAIDCEAMNATDIQIVTRRGRPLSDLTRQLAHEIARTIRSLAQRELPAAASRD
ncbi:LysR family transcriptional regulator [Pseudomonas asiatica]|uniref:LysR family transcriptional regulator n=1 Tax=Pseudomonas asiatica TaxID=2219225 RepID=UPI00383A6EEE